MSGGPVAYLTRGYRFSASHRLHTPLLSDEENREMYGRCNNPYGHGHNYWLEVTVGDAIDPDTGFVVDLPKLDELVRREVLHRFDHAHLNADAVFRGEFVPSTENLALVIEDVLRKDVPSLHSAGTLRLAGIRIEETGRNSVELPAETTGTNAHTEFRA